MAERLAVIPARGVRPPCLASGLLAAGLLCGAFMVAHAQPVSFGESDWRYVLNNESIDLVATSAIDIDDSHWLVGTAPFGNAPVCGPLGTVITQPTRIVLRKTFYLPPGSYEGAKIEIRVRGSWKSAMNGHDGNGGNYPAACNTGDGNPGLLQSGKNVLLLFVALFDDASIDARVFVPLATPVEQGTWGRLKTLYR